VTAARELPADADIEQLKLTERPAFGLRAQENIEQGRAAAAGAEDVNKGQLRAVTIPRLMSASLGHWRK